MARFNPFTFDDSDSDTNRLPFNLEQRKIKVAVLPFYDIVLLPNTSVLILLKDAPYITLIKDCIENNMLVAICLSEVKSDPNDHLNNKSKESFSEGKSEVKARRRSKAREASLSPTDTIDTTGKKTNQGQIIRTRKIAGIGVPYIQEQLSNGHLRVRIEGVGRIKLEQSLQERPYIIFEGTTIPQEAPCPPFLLNNYFLAKLQNIFQKWVIVHYQSLKEQNDILRKVQSPLQIINNISMYLIKDKEIKQFILEMENLTEALLTLTLIFHNDSYQEDLSAIHILKQFERPEEDKILTA